MTSFFQSLGCIDLTFYYSLDIFRRAGIEEYKLAALGLQLMNTLAFLITAPVMNVLNRRIQINTALILAVLFLFIFISGLYYKVCFSLFLSCFDLGQ